MTGLARLLGLLGGFIGLVTGFAMLVVGKGSPDEAGHPLFGWLGGVSMMLALSAFVGVGLAGKYRVAATILLLLAGVASLALAGTGDAISEFWPAGLMVGFPLIAAGTVLAVGGRQVEDITL